ncbi:proteasome activator complex subunit 4-like isoform X1 [Styela clava]
MLDHIQDEEIMEVDDSEERENILGFRPQKEIVYNKLLPYSADIDEESNEALAKIKLNLSKSVLAKELRPSVLHWTRQLIKYIRLYGLKFSKEDHVIFINIYLELIAIPDIEVTLVELFISALTKLLKKRELLSRSELVIEWRPLHDLCQRILYSKNEAMGLEWFPSSIDGNLKAIIRLCAVYFPSSATQEMLDEWRPLLCPFDITVAQGLKYMELFLPTLSTTEEERSSSWKLWFDEIFTVWESIHNGPAFEAHLIGLFARLALHNVGYIDWGPHCGKILTRLLRTFRLPVGKLNHMAKVSVPLQHDAIARWTVAMIGGPSSDVVLQHIENMFKSIESYYYPSNYGKWTQILLSFLQSITYKFTYRIHKERYKKDSWEGKTPKSHQITDAQISRFVKIVKPVTFLALYSKLGTMQASKVLQNLATLRPELVLPELLEKSYVALETLTEPHQLKGCMSALTSTLRTTMRYSKWYTEGRSHVIPLLFRALPAIDSNDLPKSLVAFHFISTCFTLMPIKDCSGSIQQHPDLTEEEKNLCLATAELPDFVIQFLDRIFSVVESLNQEHSTQSVESGNDNEGKFNAQETIMISAIHSSVAITLIQCSDEIYQRCLQKIFDFTSNRLIDGTSAVTSVMNLVAAAAKAKPVIASKKFIPYFCNEIKELFRENPHLHLEEKTDKQLQWNLAVLCGVCKCSGRLLLEYKEEIFEILDLTLKVEAKLAYQQACKLAKECLTSLTSYYETELGSVNPGKTKDKAYLPIRDWGKCVSPWQLEMTWHEPDKAEILMGFEMIDRYLLPELEILSNYACSQIDLSKDELLRNLTIIYSFTVGSCHLLPDNEENKVEIKGRKNIVDLKSWNVKTLSLTEQYKKVVTERGKKAFGLRRHIFETVKNGLWRVMETKEDDVKSILKIVAIYSECLMFHELYKNEFDKHWTIFANGKRAMQDTLRGNKRHQRLLVIDRVILQHQLRTLAYNRTQYNEITHNAMLDLLKLSVSHYSAVRIAAQRVFFRGMQLNPYKAEQHYLPLVLENLRKDPVENHKQLKGTLHLLHGQIDPTSSAVMSMHLVGLSKVSLPSESLSAGGKNSSYLAYLHQWDVISQVWPALINAPHSDRPSIVKLYNKLAFKIQSTYNTIAIQVQVSPGAVKAAENMLESSSQPQVGEITLTGVEERLREQNKENLMLYNKLVDDLMDTVENGKLSWRYKHLASGFLSFMLRWDASLNPRVARFFTSGLIDDALSFRRVCIIAMASILKIQQRKRKRVMLTPEEIGGIPVSTSSIHPGDRHDNKWMQYDSTKLPKTAEEYDSTIFIEKTHWGYYQWPKKLKTYALLKDDDYKIDRTVDEMPEDEKVLFEYFSDPAFVSQLMKLHALENVKGKDKYDAKRVEMFKGLFRNFADSFLENFRNELEQLSKDSHESSQRAVAELTAGLVMGTKHWNFEKVNSLWQWLVPVLQSTVDNMSVETLKDWDLAYGHMVQNRDPRKLHWLFEFLMKDPLSGKGGSFMDATRLYLIQGGMHQQEWRVSEILHRLLTVIEERLDHQYKNVRDRMGSVLASIFYYDVTILGEHGRFPPKREAFIERIFHRLSPISKKGTHIGSKASETDIAGACSREFPIYEMAEDVVMATAASDISEVEPPLLLDSDIPEQVINQLQQGLRKMFSSDGDLSNQDKEMMLKQFMEHQQQFIPPGVNQELLRDIAFGRRSQSPKSNAGIRDELESDDTTATSSGRGTGIVDEERSSAIRLLKTLMKWIISAQRVCLQPTIAATLKLLPLICKMSPVDTQGSDEELHHDTRVSLSCLAQSYIPPDQLKLVVETIGQISESSSWHARHTILKFSQIFIFNNLFTLQEKKDCVALIKEIILKLVADDQLEVREMATKTLSGLLQCGLLSIDDRLKEFINKNCKIRVKRSKKMKPESENIVKNYQEKLRNRHAGVLAVSACILSSPYSIPEYLPDLLMQLSNHLHDPQPIESTVKKTFSEFRRTHHDTWHQDKLKFTSDQLSILTDLLVSPCYYA